MGEPLLIWGVDASKRRTGIAHGPSGSKPSFVSLESRDGEDVSQTGLRLFVYLKDLLRLGKPDLVVFEKMLEFGFQPEVDFEAKTIKQKGRGIRAALDLQAMTHTLELFCGLAQIPCIEVHPSTVRKEFLGDGRLKRDVAKKRAVSMCKLLGWEVRNDDEADGGALWHYGVATKDPHRAAAIHPGMFAKAATLAATGLTSRQILLSATDEVPW
jgi:hypothetical protein